MSQPLKVAITGGIGSGKTTVLNNFKQYGIPTYIADEEAKRLMQEDDKLILSIKETFGEASYDENGNLNKSYLADKVFQDAKQLQKLNDLVHPAVRKDFQKWLNTQKSPYVIYESALVFEHGQQDLFDIIILITAPIQMRIKRIKKRNNWTEKDIKNRMDKQLDDNFKKNKVDYIINNINISENKEQVSKINNKILENTH